MLFVKSHFFLCFIPLEFGTMCPPEDENLWQMRCCMDLHGIQKDSKIVTFCYAACSVAIWIHCGWLLLILTMAIASLQSATLSLSVFMSSMSQAPGWVLLLSLRHLSLSLVCHQHCSLCLQCHIHTVWIEPCSCPLGNCHNYYCSWAFCPYQCWGTAVSWLGFVHIVRALVQANDKCSSHICLVGKYLNKTKV